MKSTSSNWGAYGHTRLRELIFGGATRHLLRDAALPCVRRLSTAHPGQFGALREINERRPSPGLT